MDTIISLYIPSVKMSYGVDNISYILWKFNLGRVNRVDFVPIMKPVEGKDPVEDTKYKQVFVYIDPKTVWNPELLQTIEDKGSYRLYPNREQQSFLHLQDDKEYWIFLKNKSPVPYSTTTLNVHQLAHNMTLLETKHLELEEEMATLKATLKAALNATLKAATNNL